MSDKWRFPAANFGDRKGISSGDAEAFKSAPYSAFAREVLQNSIDAQVSEEKPVRVVFNKFNLNTENIPGIHDLRIAIKRCNEFWAYNEDYIREYNKIESTLNEEILVCLRVSDFNTTGLVGVESSEQDGNHFLALTRGTGVSEKSGEVSGGSKGMGKNAAFLMSKVRTVFYSTRTSKNIDGTAGVNVGSIGVADFISGYLTDDTEKENRDYTQGKGYYSTDEYNNALKTSLNLDSNHNLRDTQDGTDIYIIGFRDDDNWEKDVINSILDSFMAAIVKGQLEIELNDVIITKDTIKNIVYSDIITTKNRSNLISQYRLLTDEENVKVYDIETDYGTCDLHILPFSKDEEELATHNCVMIRYPLMKIKNEPLGANFRVSAMCIIGNDTLGKMLRKIENPQHNNWESNRIMDDKALKKEMDNLLKSIKAQINEKVIECLQLGNIEPLDPFGAGDFLPDDDSGDNAVEGDNDSFGTDVVTVTKPKETIVVSKNANEENDEGFGLQPDIGKPEPEKTGPVIVPSGNNGGKGGDPHIGPNTGGKGTGNNEIQVRAKLSGVKYNVLAIDKNKGEYRIIFKAPINFPKCYLNIGMLDDSNSREEVKIDSMKCNGNVIISDNKISDGFGPFAIKQNEKVILDIVTDIKSYFAATIKVICIEEDVKQNANQG